MIKRLSKARRTAILEHLLSLEKQIRAEFDGSGDSRNTETRHLSESDLRSQRASRGGSSDESRMITSEFTARFMH